MIGSIKCNFQKTPFNFIFDTVAGDWSGAVSISSTLSYSSTSMNSATYATLSKSIPIKEGAILNLGGSLAYSSSLSSSNTYYAYSLVQISKDNGASWITLFSDSVANTASGGSSYASKSISKNINLSAYVGYDCRFRIGAYQNRHTSGATSAILTLSAFNIYY